MKVTSNLGNAAMFELYRVTLTNVQSNERIMEILNENGISVEVLNQGTALLEIVRDKNMAADLTREKRKEAYKSYSEKKFFIDETFINSKKKSAIVFLKDLSAQEKLGLNARREKTYVKWLPRVKSFYITLNNNPELAEKLSTVGISVDDISEMQTHIEEIEKLRANYINEKGNAQNATDEKSEAMANLSLWMSKFFAFAKNTFKHQPQLMESFDIVVRS